MAVQSSPEVLSLKGGIRADTCEMIDVDVCRSMMRFLDGWSTMESMVRAGSIIMSTKPKKTLEICSSHIIIDIMTQPLTSSNRAGHHQCTEYRHHGVYVV